MNEHETKTDEVLEGEAASDTQATSTQPVSGAAPPDGGAADPGLPESAGDPADQVRALEQSVAEREEALLRLQAEFENMRKRAARDVENARKYALERFVAELLPVKDSMELGIAACANDGADLQSVREGVELTHKMLDAAVEKFGVAPIDPQGEAFNPEFHQAMSMQETDGLEAGRVVMVVQKGYTLNDRLVRPAMVIVSK